MSPSWSGHGNVIYRYYRCRSTAGGRRSCQDVCVPVFELDQYVLKVLGDPSLGHPEADHQRQALAARWGTLKEREQRELLRQVVQEVVFHSRNGTVSITLAPDAAG